MYKKQKMTKRRIVGNIIPDDLRFGRIKYLSFVVLDLIGLVLSNTLAAWLYLDKGIFEQQHYSYSDYRSVISIMVVIDLVVTFVFNTLQRVLRRKNEYELTIGGKHVCLSFIILAFVLFTLRQGAEYSRITVYLGYIFYYVFFVVSHIGWRAVLKLSTSNSHKTTAMLMTTDGFVNEGLQELQKLNIDVKRVYFLKNLNREEINGIPVVKTWEEAAASICWDMLDRVYIYGLDHQMVPEYLVKACREMGMNFSLIDFNYRILDVTTIQNPDPQYGSLSFLEGKRDIPFPIRRVYWITETEANLHRGFHAHKLNCQLLYCPYGKIDIILDDGQNKNTVTLDRPGKGLLLMPGLWREMVWQQSGSVLCVLASEYYDASEYIRDYDEFIEYNKKYRDSADPLKQ